MFMAAILLCGIARAAAETIDFPGAFRLGSSLEEAKRHAISRDWQLVPLSSKLPGQWVVKEKSIGVFVCGDTVTGISQSVPGDLDDFAQIVFDLQLARGEPELQVKTFMAGSTRISNIDANFPEVGGLGVRVQFSSTEGKLAINTNYFLGVRCPSP